MDYKTTLAEVFRLHDEMEELKRCLIGPVHTRMEAARQLQQADNKFEQLREAFNSAEKEPSVFASIAAGCARMHSGDD